METPRVVLDTNVLISGLCFGGVPGRILGLVVEGKIELATSAALVEEFKAVMELKFPRRETAIQDTMAELSLLWDIVPASLLPKISAVAADPSDNKVLECAAAARAHCIITGDGHLLDIGQFGGIIIVSPAQFIRQFKF